MADLTATDVAANFEKHNGFTSLGRTVIVTLAKTDITDADLKAAITYMTTVDGADGDLEANGSDAFTVVAMTAFESGVTDSVTLALQGTGTITKAGIEANDGTIGFTATIVADFDQTFKGAA